MISKDLPLKMSLGKEPSCDLVTVNLCNSLVGNVRPKMSTNVFSVGRSEQVKFRRLLESEQTHGVIKNESGHCTALKEREDEADAPHDNKKHSNITG